MKGSLALAVLVLAGGTLAWIGWNAKERSYVPVTIEEPEALPPTPTTLTGDPPPGYITRSFEIEGMCCTGCSGSLHKALSQVDGVAQAAIDFDTGVATVHVSQDVEVERLLAALTTDKYSARLTP